MLEISDAYLVTIDFTLRRFVKTMIRNSWYTSVDEDVTQAHFPVIGHGKVGQRLFLASQEQSTSSDEMIAKLDQQDLRPANTAELLTFVKQRPERRYLEETKDEIVALGAIWTIAPGARRVLAVSGCITGRKMHLYETYFKMPERFRSPMLPIGSDWYGGTFFLAAPKDS